MGAEKVLEHRSLPVALKGYDRGATDSLLKELEEVIQTKARLHADALARIGELERRIAEGEEREQAVTEALVVASRVRAESEAEGEKIKEESAREAEAVREEAGQKADEIVEAANAEAETIVEKARTNARDIGKRMNDADQLAQLIHTHLTSFLQSMLAEVERRSADSASVFTDLLARAGKLADVPADEIEEGEHEPVDAVKVERETAENAG